ncbi:MAG: PD40 domain-containing protein [Lentisphaeria bacterium]|nr:PD40 domain-containing protein [Lentisphaeria bacterium]
MLKTKLSILAVLLFAVAFPRLDARVIEIKKKAELNPTVYFSGVPGNPKLSNDIRTFLGVCGWFDLSNDAAKSDYTVAAEPGSGNLVIRLYQSKTPVAAWRFPLNSDSREVAKTVVDTVIERAFAQLKVRGFCRSRIAFTAESAPGIRNVFICDIDGNNVQQITSYRSLNVEPSWSPSGKSIYFSKYNRSGIEIVETTVATPRRSRIISSSRGINTGAAVSPDGSMLAVILSPDHQVDLYLLGLRHRERRRLTRGIAVEASPCWSPDGRSIAFVSDRRGNPRIFISDTSGRNLKVLPSIGADAVTPAWSKDGKIAYATRIAGNYTIAVYDTQTGENRRVVALPGNWESPEWAADNRQVVCKRTIGGKSALYVIDTRTGKQRLLLQTNSKLFDPSWSPCLKRN